MENFRYINEIKSLSEILFLGMTMSVMVCFSTEKVKSSGISDKRLCMAASVMFSAFYGTLFCLCYESLGVYEGIWLVIFLWMSSQGFYEYLKKSDGYFGKMFVSLEERMIYAGAETKTEEEGKMIFPVNYVGISGAFTKTHPAVDFGYSLSHGGKNQPVIAPADMKIISVGEGKDIGKYIRAYSEGGGKYTFRFIHLSSIAVSKGQKVKKGEVIGKMGNTGTSSNGHHLHFDIWKGHTADLSGTVERYECSVNPLDVCYLAEDQTVGEETDKKYEIMRV